MTALSGGGRERRGIVVHRSALAPEEVTRVEGIPVTNPARTILDLADSRQRRALERAIDEAAYLRLDLSDLEPRAGRRGFGLLARILDAHDPGSTLTRSQLEERFLRLCRRLPAPQVNTWIEGVDTDGHTAHGTRAAFERDRSRDAELTAAGWRVVRLTYRRIMGEPRAVAAQLRRLLGLDSAPR